MVQKNNTSGNLKFHCEAKIWVNKEEMRMMISYGQKYKTSGNFTVNLKYELIKKKLMMKRHGGRR